ncbi:MAG TPA: folylpolyglutamate synthase/dihydrofolate synthase family protein [Gemmatimonadaceae bacterium]|nr:folylpolyglutamate synthase/dihydrofolate synthase family protein [Gemmatimonadaceae bacterium]
MDRGLTEYRTALDALFARTGSTAKFGLERTLGFLGAIGNPHQRYPSFHIAGTNGKGSVVATISTLLKAKGLKVGRYMSPHLIDFRERIAVDGEAISEEYVTEFLARWSPYAESLGATFFEITTAMAFHYFATREVDVAVVETGLGGRLDSTNVIDPLVSGITSIGLDHQEFLGDTEESIAREKAGILKRGRPAVIGSLSTSARVAVYQAAEAAGVPRVIEAERLYPTKNVVVSLEGTSFTIEYDGHESRVHTGLVGSAQAANVSVALAMLRAATSPWTVSIDEAASTLPSVKLPGRFQRVGNCILDVAHNPDGIRSVVSTLELVQPPRPLIAVLGILNDKDWRGMIAALAPSVERIILVAPPSAPPARAWIPAEAEKFAQSIGVDASVEADFDATIRAASGGEGTTIITGSFHTVGDALITLGEKTL